MLSTPRRTCKRFETMLDVQRRRRIDLQLPLLPRLEAGGAINCDVRKGRIVVGENPKVRSLKSSTRAPAKSRLKIDDDCLQNLHGSTL